MIVLVLLSATSFGDELFQDTFNRPGNNDINANIPMGQRGKLTNLQWREHQLVSDEQLTKITANRLLLANGSNMSAASIDHNFIDDIIMENGGFKVILNIAEFNASNISGDPTDTYCGFGVGLTPDELNRWNVFNRAGNIRGIAERMGAADFWVGLANPNQPELQIRSNGRILETIPVEKATGELAATFNISGFEKDNLVEVFVQYNGSTVDINSADPASNSRTFTWQASNANYIAVEGRASQNIQLDEFGIFNIPKRYAAPGSTTKRVMKKVVTNKKGIAGLFGFSLILLLLLRRSSN